MRKNIEHVIKAFADKRTCNEKTCSTDGETIFSYETPVALRTGDGSIYLLSHFPTRTTQAHISAINSMLECVLVDSLMPWNIAARRKLDAPLLNGPIDPRWRYLATAENTAPDEPGRCVVLWSRHPIRAAKLAPMQLRGVQTYARTETGWREVPWHASNETTL